MSAERSEGRGQLSSIDMLPEEADGDIVWALDQLREMRLPQSAILMEFNERLADKGIDQVSKSSFNRYSIRKAKQFRKMDQAQRMARELVQSMGTEEPDQVTIIVAEMVKVAALGMLEDGELSSKGLMELSRALQSAVSAQKGSADYREKLEREVQAKLAKAAEAVNDVGKRNGISPEALEEINRRLMGGA